MATFELVTVQGTQQATVTSFAGGHPRLPVNLDLPTCRQCNQPLTFFYQVAFPEEHVWAGHSLAVFACTSTWHPNDLIPQLLPKLENVLIPEGYLERYQTTFRLLVFRTEEAVVREDYDPKVKFESWALQRAKTVPVDRSKLGGKPEWVQHPEAPASYAGEPLRFLMQLAVHRRFECLAHAAPQANDPQFERLLPPKPYYFLFVGNAVYFWGTPNPLDSDV